MAHERIAPDLLKFVTDIASLQPDPCNARLHDDKNVKAVMRSLEMYGQQKPVVVCAESGKILAGNGTVQAATKLGWEKIARVRSDLSDPKSQMGYSIADNRTSDLAGWDYDVLTTQLKELADEGIKSAGDLAFTKIDLATMVDEGKAHSVKDLDQIGEELFGKPPPEITLPEYQFYDSNNNLGIPNLRPDKISAPPGKIRTWVSKTKSSQTDDGECVWLKLWGRSESGVPTDRCIVAFYTHDFKFEAAWEKTDEVAYWMLSNGVTHVIGPNFSQFENEPLIIQMHNRYKSMWIMRYFQECGLGVIPDMHIATSDEGDWGLLGIPNPCPVMCIQVQTQDAEQLGRLDERVEYLKENFGLEELIFYGGRRAEKIFKALTLDIPYRFVHSISDEVAAYFKENREPATPKGEKPNKQGAR